MAEIRFVEAQPDDVEFIASNLRAEDLEELRAAHGDDADPVRILHLSCRLSDRPVVAMTAAGEPLAVFGVVPVSMMDRDGRPWMMATDGAMRFRREIVRGGRYWTNLWSFRYARLHNHVDARNVATIRWLRHIGYTIGEPVPYGTRGLPFHPFERCA